MENAFQQALKLFHKNREAVLQQQPIKTPQFPVGTPTYDDQGRILSFTGYDSLPHPVDFTDQALAKRMAVLNRFIDPRTVTSAPNPALQRATLFTNPTPPNGEGQGPSDTEANMQDSLMQYYHQEFTKRYGF